MTFLLFDARYATDSDRATILSASETMKDALEDAESFSDDSWIYNTETKEEWLVSELINNKEKRRYENPTIPFIPYSRPVNGVVYI